MIRLLISGCMALMPIVSLLALEPSVKLSQLVYQSWTTDQGLPQNSVLSIVQSDAGFLWFGTQEGFVRFDGRVFDVYDRENVPAMTRTSVRALVVGGDDSIWVVGEDGSIFRRANDLESRTELVVRLETDLTNQAIEGQLGELWVATLDRGVFVVDTEGINRRLDEEHGLPADRVWSLCRDDTGAIWVGTEQGLARWNGTALSTWTASDGLTDARIWSLATRRQGGVWIGTGGGILAYRDGHFDDIDMGNGLVESFSLLEDRDGSLWVGTANDGILRLNDKRLERFSRPQGLAHDSVVSIFEDREGSIWVGTDGGGLARFREAPVISYGKAEGLRNEMVRSVLVDSSDRVWIGTDGGGLSCLDRDELSTWTTDNGLSDNRVLCVYEDRSHGIWVSTYDGLSYFDGREFKVYGVDDGLPARRIGTVHQSSDGTMWIATQLGLVAMKDGSTRLYNRDDGLSSNLVRNIYEAKDGILWIGTRGGGLNRFDGKRFDVIGVEDGLSSNQILAIVEHRDGIWVGTSDHGLNLIQADEIHSVDRRDGLFDDKILEIVDDGQGHFWMSSNKGIFSVSIEQLYACALGEIGRVDCRVFGVLDGMKSSECNGGNFPAGGVDAQGRIWFPTIRGAVAVRPDMEIRDAIPPVTVVKNVMMDGHRLDPQPLFQLPSNLSSLEIQFAAPSLRAPSRIQFRCRMLPEEQDWRVIGDRRHAIFTNLNPGPHVFEVVGRNDLGVWSKEPAQVNFRFLAPWYASIWFKGLMVLVVVFLIALGISIRRWLVARRTRELARLVDERAHKIKEGSRRLLDAQDQMVDAAHRAGMAELANSVLGRVQELVVETEETLGDLGNRVGKGGVKQLVKTLGERLPDYDSLQAEQAEAVIADLASLPSRFRDERDDMLERVLRAQSAFQQMGNLIASQQDLAKVERAPDRIDVNQIVGDVIRLKSELLSKLGIEVIQDLVPVPRIHGQRSLMMKALLNLVQNCCEALENHEGDRLIRIRSSRLAGKLTLEISDSGGGVPEELNKRIFMQGFTTKAGHAGLGLHAAANAIAQLHGVIGCDHDMRGSWFWISFSESRSGDAWD